MSIGIDGFSESDVSSEQEAAHLANLLANDQGIEEGLESTVYRRAAERTARIIFESLKIMGYIPSEGFDLEDFKTISRAIVNKSIHSL